MRRRGVDDAFSWSLETDGDKEQKKKKKKRSRSMARRPGIEGGTNAHAGIKPWRRFMLNL